MSKIPPSIVEDAHSYTRSETPWLLDTYRDAHGETTKGKKFGWKLFHYLSGGGMRAFGRTVAQEESEERRSRFLVACAVAALVWLYFWF
ncbi:MAG: hypothetical protein K6F50_03285 [Kiritimatiellae bacterium]|nr:hypothetical protein [Kiritimatiellia bacterium]